VSNTDEPTGPGLRVAKRSTDEARFYYRPEAPRQESLGLFDVLGFLRRRALLIVSLGTVVTALVAFWTYTLPRRYESTASFLVETQSRTSTEALAILDRLGSGQTTETESELLLGRRVVEPVVDSMNLHLAFVEGYEVAPEEVFTLVDAGPEAEPGRYRIALRSEGYTVWDEESGTRLATAPGGGVLEFAGIRLGLPEAGVLRPSVLEIQPFAQAVQATLGRLSASSSSRQSVILNLSCSGGSPSSAHSLCTAVQESFLDFREELQRAEAVATSTFLRDQVSRVEIQLAEAEDSLRAFRARTGAIALQQQANQGVLQAASLQASRRELTAEQEALTALIDQIEAGGEGAERYRDLASFPTFLQANEIVSSWMQALVALENRRTDLAVRRTLADPELASVVARIAEIEEDLLGIAEGYRESLAAQIASIDGSIQDQSQDLSRIPTWQLETVRRERRFEVLDELYRYLQSRLQEAEVAEAVALPGVRVVDAPSLPYEPSWPNVPLNLAMGLFLGASTGVLGGLWREYTDQRVRERDEVHEWGLPVLTMVPRVPRHLLPRPGSGPGEKPRKLSGRTRRSSIESLALLQESFRSLTFEIEAAGLRMAGAGVGSVAISSAGRGDGKTFCACSLAMQAAVSGQRTLLLDADLRARGVARWFQLGADSPGLADLVAPGQESLDQVRAMIQTVEVAEGKSLDILPSGPESSASALLVTSTLRRLLRAASEYYDLVVVDTPPLAVISDAAQVASQVDGVIVVVRPGVTERPALTRALDRLSRVGAEVLGLVINEVEVPHSYYGYPGEPS
jgi:capsular exopolysaccharide synthesis family protein